ncbi:MAG: gluconate 2-dehydrogenase subunit 3 family protein [Acidobacteriota bacterium]|nr:gluconate 2-dehydrogenase subunit 3 family protein [Acidobacteriota bacterium]
MGEVGGATGRVTVSRRAFLAAAAAAGALAALPLRGATSELASLVAGTGAAGGPEPLPGGPFFLVRDYVPPGATTACDLYATTAAVCARVVPTDGLGPGADEAGAVNYVDLFLSAFDAALIGSGLADHSPIYVHGRNSGRWPYAVHTGPGAGGPATTFPADDFETLAGTQVQTLEFLGLTPLQAVAWYARIHGGPPPAGAPSWPATPWPSWTSASWAAQVTSTQGVTGSPPTVPGAENLRQLYLEGLVAFDDWSRQNFETPFAQATAAEQEALVALATDPLLGAASQNGLPGLPAPLPDPVPPPAAAALAPVTVLHAIQGSYGLPEYGGRSDKVLGGQATWASIGFDGDTMPLGNSVYVADIGENQPAEPDNQFSNDGFGFPPIYSPSGAYVEYRPVSHPAADAAHTVAPVTAFQDLVAALERAGFDVTVIGG